MLQEYSVRLDTLRKQLNLSREEMAAHLGLTMSGYAKTERGETFLGIAKLARLAKAFDISLDWLLINRGPIFYRLKEDAAKPAPGEPVEPKPPETETTKPSAAGATVELANTLPQALAPDSSEPWFPAGLEGVCFDVEKMLEQMALDPQLRYEILAYFHKYIKGHPAADTII